MTTGSITLSRVQLFINNFPFYCKLPQANDTLIKTKFDLGYFAVWQWQAAHSCAEPTQLCSKIWQHALSSMLPSPCTQLPGKKPVFCWCRKRELRGFSSNSPTPAQTKWKVPKAVQTEALCDHSLLALYSQVTVYSGPVSSLICSFQKISHISSVFLLQVTTVIITTVSNSGCLLRPKNCFPLGGRKASPMLGKAVPLPVKLTLKCWYVDNGIVLHLWHFK